MSRRRRAQPVSRIRIVLTIAFLLLLLLAPAVYVGALSSVGEWIGGWYADRIEEQITTTTTTTSITVPPG